MEIWIYRETKINGYKSLRQNNSSDSNFIALLYYNSMNYLPHFLNEKTKTKRELL